MTTATTITALADRQSETAEIVFLEIEEGEVEDTSTETTISGLTNGGGGGGGGGGTKEEAAVSGSVDEQSGDTVADHLTCEEFEALYMTADDGENYNGAASSSSSSSVTVEMSDHQQSSALPFGELS